MEITLKDKNGVVLHTEKKYCKEDIAVNLETEEVNIIPTTEEQIVEGLISKATVLGDVDLISENIKKGVTIFNVEGGFDAVDTRDATATSNDIVEGTTAYVNNQKIDGNVPNNGELEYNPSDEEQAIPAGLTSGGVVKATDITTLSEYEACLTLANSIDNLDNYSDTTATAEDIVKGKTAYSNGKKIVGNLTVIVSPTEPTGENRKAIWLQKNVKNLINSPIVFGDAKSRSCYNRAYCYGNSEIKGGETYTYNTNLPITYQYVIGVTTQKVPAEYGGDVSFVFDSGWKTNDGSSYTFTSPSDGYLALGIRKPNNEAFDYYVDDISLLNTYNYQVEKGSTATEYEEYIEPKLYMLNENDEYIEVK